MMAARLAEARAAVTLLTRVPAGGGTLPVAAAAWAFPLVGAAVGIVSWAVFAIAAASGLPVTVSALLAVAGAVWLTGGLHEDGLADFADGVGGGREREARLAIMRDSRIGTFGALALVFAVGLRVLAVAELGGEGPLLAAFVAMGAASRFAVAAALGLMPPARADGLGRGAGRPGAGVLAAGLGLTVLCLLPLGQVSAAILALIGLAAALTGVLAMRKLGGQTGDVLGAIQVVAEVAGWLALVAAVAG